MLLLKSKFLDFRQLLRKYIQLNYDLKINYNPVNNHQNMYKYLFYTQNFTLNPPLKLIPGIG